MHHIRKIVITLLKRPLDHFQQFSSRLVNPPAASYGLSPMYMLERVKWTQMEIIVVFISYFLFGWLLNHRETEFLSFCAAGQSEHVLARSHFKESKKLIR